MAVITYKCTNCGGDLQFDPATQTYHCQYCKSNFSQENLESFSKKEDEALKPQETTTVVGGDGALLYQCPSCGAEIVTDETTTATFCYYCHNPVVLAGKMEGEYHPDCVIPFAIDKKKALEIFGQWMAQKKYIPKEFYTKEQIEKMTGVYFPYWLYTCTVEGKLEGEGTKLKTWMTGNTQFVQTEKFQISREGIMPIQHVTRNALKKANRQLVEGVLPFEMDKLQPFHMGYLSGFQAEKRDMEQEEFVSQVEQEIQEYATENLRSQVSEYDSISVENQTATIENPKWEYALMPVWTLTYNHKKTGKIYYFACNGQTGKVCGELPVDHGRLLTLFASIFLPLLLFFLIVGYFI